MINQELNSIMNQGYELIKTDFGFGSSQSSSGSFQGLHDGGVINIGATFLFGSLLEFPLV